MHIHRSRSSALVAISILIVLASCSDDSTAPPPPDDGPFDGIVHVLDDSFSPRDATITEGDSVTWRFEGNTSHTVTHGTSPTVPPDSLKLFDSPIMTTGTFGYRFDDPGTFAYFCRPHFAGGMTGTITVEPTFEAGDIMTWAGTGQAGFDGDGHSRTETEFYWPQDIEFTPTLGAFVSDWNNHRIRRLEANGTFHTIIGRDSDGDGPDAPAGVPGTECELNHPTEVWERSNGKLVVVCWHNHKLREWDPATGLIKILVGRGPGCTGDGASITLPTSKINQAPHAVEAADGSIFINDQRNQCIRKIDPAGILSTVVSTPACPTDTFFPPGGFAGDDGPPSLAMIAQPTGSNPNPPGGGLALDAQQRLYIADTNNHRIRRVDFVANVITTVVGDGVQGFGGDDGEPLLASLNTPLDIVFGPDGRLYIADTYNDRVRAVDFTANVITTVAGTGVQGFSGDGGPATSAKLALPYGVGFDADGHLYIADTYNNRIRKVLMHD